MAFSTSIASRGLNSVYDPIIISAANNYGVEVALIKAIISQESVWNPDAVNPNDPSYGLMQLNYNYFKMPDGSPILDPAANIDQGTKLLRDLKRFGAIESVISAYNAGHPITSNQVNYVQPVLQYYQWFKTNDPASGGTGGGDSTFPPEPTDDSALIAGIAVFAILVVVLLRR